MIKRMGACWIYETVEMSVVKAADVPAVVAPWMERLERYARQPIPSSYREKMIEKGVIQLQRY